MCLIIDYKSLNWHLMRLKRVINIPPCAKCSQALELFSITNTSIYSSKSINLEWGELILPFSLTGFMKGSLLWQQKESPKPIDSSSEKCRERLTFVPHLSSFISWSIIVKSTAHCEVQLLQSVHSDCRRSYSSFLLEHFNIK